MTKRRTVVTGMGVLSTIGLGLPDFWAGLMAGRVGTKKATQFDTTGLCSDRAGEITHFDPQPYFKTLEASDHERATWFAVAASRMAVQDAKLDVASVADRAGIVMGVVVANRPGLESAYSALYADGESVPPMIRNDVAWVCEAPAIELGLRGPSMVLPTACAAGNSAVGWASDLIENDHADIMLAGGADELSPAMFVMFSQFSSLAPDCIRPFDKERKGLIMSEGSAVLLLEEEHHARARGARIYATLVGHGNFADAHDMTHPHPDGLGARWSMEAALKQGGLSTNDVDYVCAHGTGTPTNDPIEAKAIRAVFASHTDSLPVSSIKSMIGHTQGAASAIESVACILAMHEGFVPPTVNLRELDSECPIDPVANKPRAHSVEVAMNNAFGFGGNISCVVFAKS